MSRQKPVADLTFDNDRPDPHPARLSATEIAELTTAFKALSDPVRLRLLTMIATHPNGEACVCDLTPAFAVSGPTISYHLKTLRQAGLVTSDRRGTWIFYRPVVEVLHRLADALQQTGNGLDEVEPGIPHHPDC